MVPLDPLWDGGFLTVENIHQIAEKNTQPWCLMASKIFERTGKLVQELGRNPVNGIGTVSPPDLLAVGVAIDPEIAVMFESYVDLETHGEFTRGMTVLDRRQYYRKEDRPNKTKVKIVISAIQEKYAKLVLDTWVRD